MQHTTPYFSIIIPAYNVEKYIGRAISSVLNQSFQDFEIIVMNSASTDKTSSIIEEFASKNNKISIVNHAKRESLHIARIDGVLAATGKYILFLDGDDYFNQNAFSILFDTIQKNPKYDFYEFGYIIQPSEKTVLPSFLETDRFSAYFDRDNYLAFTMWNKVYDIIFLKKALNSIERVYLPYSEDVYESIIIAYYAQRTYNIKEIITNYSIGTGVSTTYNNYSKTIEQMQYASMIISLVENFVIKMNQNVNIDNLSFRLLSFIISSYINLQKDEKDRLNLFLNLNNYFKNKVILEYLSYKEKLYHELLYKEELYHELLSIKNSIDYRLGQKLLYPLRKIKLFFRIRKKNNI